jgi:hypothetical protein
MLKKKQEHDPEKREPLFGKRSRSKRSKSMIPKSGNHFSEKDHAQTRSESGLRRRVVLL